MKYKVWAAQIHSFKNDVLRALALYNAGPFQDVVEILLRRTMLLACGRSLGCKIGVIHLRPLHFDAGEGHPGTLDISGPLYSMKPRAGIDQPLYKPKITAGYGFVRPKIDYDILHGQFGHPMQFDQLLQLITEGP